MRAPAAAIECARTQVRKMLKTSTRNSSAAPAQVLFVLFSYPRFVVVCVGLFHTYTPINSEGYSAQVPHLLKFVLLTTCDLSSPPCLLHERNLRSVAAYLSPQAS